MQLGHFDDEAREYVITDPRTPVRWINYLGDLEFGGFVDHTGGSVLCKQDPALNRITRYIAQLPPSSFNGETAYVKVMQGDGSVRITSPFWVPTLEPLEDMVSYECRVGLGYTQWTHRAHTVSTRVRAFVPQDGKVMLRHYRITNQGTQPVQIQVYPVVEFSHFDALKQFTNADWVPQTMQAQVRQDSKRRKAVFQYAFMNKERAMNVFGSSIAPSSFETDRAKFLGGAGWGTWQHPEGVTSATLGDTQALRGDTIAALQVTLGTLQPGETREFVTVLSQAASWQEGLAAIETWADPQKAEQAFEDLKQSWNRYLGTFQVETPDPAFNSMVNIHNPRQCRVTKDWSRYLSLYQLGFGSRGIGCRDTAQDILAITPFDPMENRRLLSLLLSIQRRDGSAMHQVNPLSLQASIGDAAEMEDRPDYYGDDHLWLVLAAEKYIKETGDTGFLQDTIPFYEKQKGGVPQEEASVYEHLTRAVQFTLTHCGESGLPLLGFVDWNDTVNLPTGAESVFIAALLGKALKAMEWLASYIGKADDAKTFASQHAEMAKVVNTQAWDGEWYIRYRDHQGKPMGSSKNPAGALYANAQSWPIMAGFVDPERQRSALNAVNGKLASEHGIVLSAPGYNGYDPVIGGVTTYPPGAKENGGIFLHANPWVIIAEVIAGNPDRAFDYYSRINPAAKNDSIEVYECEPYVFAQNILGPEHPQFGLGRNSWLTGTSSWMYQAATEYILGIRADGDALVIDPAIPSHWQGFTARRVFQSVEYSIRVTRTGTRRVRAGGRELTSPRVPLALAAGSGAITVEVEV